MNSTAYEFYKNTLNSARYIVAPMVDQSELSWRMLSRKYGAHLCYTPMMHAKLFASCPTYREKNFQTCPEDRPLIAQFCANDADVLLEAAKHLEDKCDAIDINLGCPQGIARKGHYGSFLQDEWELIASMVSKLDKNLKIPVTCKIRIFEDVKKSIDYAKTLEANGCKLLVVHGRTREQKAQNTGIADWEQIKMIKDALNIPVIANGNILYYEDIQKCIDETNVDGVMVAEGNLSNPYIFNKECIFIPDVVDDYLQLVEKYPTNTSAIKAHFFRLYRPCLSRFTDLRDKLANARSVQDYKDAAAELRKVLEYERNACDDAEYSQGTKYTLKNQVLRDYPFWLCQPYVRPETISGNLKTKRNDVPEFQKKLKLEIEKDTECNANH